MKTLTYRPISWLAVVAALFFAAMLLPAAAQAFTVSVVDQNGNSVTGFKWLVQEDTTFDIAGGDTLSLGFHASYAPVVATGTEANATNAPDPPPGKRYFVSVLPDGGYTMSGAPVEGDAVTVKVHQHPIPTAQISVFVFEDNRPINNTPDLPEEQGLEGFKIVLEDAGGRYGISAGMQMMDAFGNPLGTVYDDFGNVTWMGDGVITTDAQGNALIKNLAPGKYGVTVVPPAGQDWHQTSTIEGKKVIDAWVKPGEPPFFVEFGPPGYHVFVGFVHTTHDTAVLDPTGSTSTISGRVVNLHNSRPPDFTFWPGQPIGGCWVGLNTPSGGGGVGTGVYAQPCNPDSTFQIPNVPAGTHDLVIWDENLDVIFATKQVTVDGTNSLALGDVPVFNWFGRLEALVFNDLNGDGFRDATEPGIPEQAVNIRFRDGSVYQSFPTDLEGTAPFDEVFPFFHWLVAEVDFSRFRATGATFVVDAGGPIDPTDPWSFDGVLNPQPQSENAGLPYRLETGEVLTQAFQLFLGQTIRMEFGKQEYGPGDNGGITGVVYYATTRAEDDPGLAAAEPWEPGVPRVQVNLYSDTDGDGVIDDIDGVPGINLADVDNYPFGDFPGPGDIDRNTNGVFDQGDAIQITTTDSWDDNLPGNCQGNNNPPGFEIPGLGNNDCFDGLRNFNQARPGVFDGGYAFGGVAPGIYIVEAVPPPGYEIVKEQDKNVDFGDTYNWPATETPGGSNPVPQQAALDNTAICVGDNNLVPPYLALFPGMAVPAPYAGQNRPLCDRKQVALVDELNAAADFFVFTEVPVAGHIVGVIVDDTANEFDPTAPAFGEKYSPPDIPISIRDWEGNVIGWTQSDKYGAYNALVPSTYTANLPQPSGMSPSMITVVLNDPGYPGNLVPPNPKYSQFSYTFQYMPGTTTYLDTPVVPIAAFAGPGQTPVDVEFPDGTPVIAQVDGGPYVAAAGDTITIYSMGAAAMVPNPAYQPDPSLPNYDSNPTITRDYGFGGSGIVTIGGVPLENVNWTSGAITGTVAPGTTTGQLVVTRADTYRSSVLSVTVTVGPIAGTVHSVTYPGRIQAAIDAAAPGDLILVGPGEYDELVIMTKPVHLQGWGAGVTAINAVQAPNQKILNWRQEVQSRWLAGDFDLVTTNEVNLAGIEPVLASAEGAGISVFAKNTTEANGGYGPNFKARIDGFDIRGASTGGGIFVNGYAHHLQISNNRIEQNSGFSSGGIRVGHPDLIIDTAAGLAYVSAFNDHIRINNNQITGNGGLGGAGGGISLYTGTDHYEVTGNWIAGNFTQGSGGGIGHLGRSEGGTIARNKIIFNQSFNQGAAVAGGGIFIGGAAPPVAGGPSPGSGKVTVDANLVQGNLAGAGDGGGIRIASTADPISVTSNFIVNNVTGLAGGGISIQDAASVEILHNTVAHNDSTATAGAAFALPNQSTPQTAGIAAQASVVVLDSNIIWENRSFYFQMTDPLTFGLVGAASQDLSPGLVSTNGILTGDGDPQFVAPYFNNARGTTILQQEFTTAPSVMPAFDEGGNFIDVRFGPLSIEGSDYHVQSGSSAIGTGTAGLTQTDADGDLTTVAGTAVSYAGADRYTPAANNLAPVAVGDAYNLLLPNNSSNPAARTLTVSGPGVLGNDFDPDGDTMSVSLLQGVGFGTLTLAPDGSFTYVADRGFEGTVSFTYLASDGSRASAAAVSIAVANRPANDAPVPTALDIITPMNTPGTTRVLPNDPNVGDTHTYDIVGNPQNGTATVSAAGTVTFTPDANFLGFSSVTVRVRDQDNAQGMVTFAVTVNLNLPPSQDIQVQMPYDSDGIDTDGDGIVDNDNVYMLLGAGDGFTTMADGKEQYIFSFHDLSYALPAVNAGDPSVRTLSLGQIMADGMLSAEFPAPTIRVKQGQKLYLNLANLGMAVRPDLFDPHTVHWHGFPEASSVFDGVPDASIAVNMMSNLTYFYNVVWPGTYMYHCHVEATEHMQMGMLGSLYVTPIQDGTPYTYQGRTYTRFAYNDGDGSTGYDVDYPIQMGSFDPAFHDASVNVQPLPFANMADRYAMLNGRGYPDTVNEGALTPAADNTVGEGTVVRPTGIPAPERTFRLKAAGLLLVDDEYNGLDLIFTSGVNQGEFRRVADYVGATGEIVLASALPAAPGIGDTFAIGRVSQRQNAKITAAQGERILLRLSNLNVTRFYTLASTIPMKVVGQNARLLRGPSPDGGVTPGKDLYYDTNSVTLGGGESLDIIVDTAAAAPGTYLLYTPNLNYLTNDQEDFGGMMTEITITTP